MTTATLDALDRAIRRMPPLPEVATRLLEMLRDPEFSIDDLVGVVRTDPNLTARILKLCNSSLYSRATEVETIREAVSYLGSRNLVQVVVSTCSRICFDALTPGADSDPEEIRRHAFSCATAAEHVVERIVGPSPGAAFTAGILHDLGRVALAQAVRRQPRPRREAGESKLDHERRAFGIDHAQVAEMVAERWTLPHELRRAITHHHDAEHIAVEPPLTAALHVAEVLADAAAEDEPAVTAILARVEPNALARLSLGFADLDRLVEVARSARAIADGVLATS